MGYCARVDMAAFLPSGGLPSPARVATSSVAGNYLESDQHGLVDGAAVTLRAAGGGSVPAPLVAGTTYYALVLSTTRFRLSATPLGAPITLTVDGVNFTFWSDLPWQAWIDAGARDVDSFLPAHVVPVVAPYPQILITANAELAALRALVATGGATIDYGVKLDAIRVRLTQWAKALPIRGVGVQTQQPVNLAVTSVAGATDPRGWASSGNGVLP